MTVSQPGVSALLALGGQLEEQTEKIHQLTAQLRNAYDENQEGLGPHSESILRLLEEVESAGSEASIPVKKLVLKLTRAAAIRQELINQNRYSSGKSR